MSIIFRKFYYLHYSEQLGIMINNCGGGTSKMWSLSTENKNHNGYNKNKDKCI